MSRLLPLLALVSACAVDGDEPELADGVDDSFLSGGKDDSLIGENEARAVLALANGADFETLDDDVGLDRRAAEHMVAHRDGLDEIAGTADDDPFDSLAELDAVKWVGPRAFGKLRAYVIANGLVPRPDDCLIISEYIESWGQYNKAIEIYNCGAAEISLDRYSVCLVRDNDDGCTLTSDLGTAALAPGAVTTVCRRKAYHPAALDPIPMLAEACELERPGVMTFSGDDRLLILNQDGSVADSLGRVGYKPAPDTWADVVLDRCNFEPADGVSFYDHRDFFESFTSGHFQSYGQPPIESCQ